MENVEVDYSELSSVNQRLSSTSDQILNGRFDQVPVGDPVYGFAVLTQAVQVFTQSLTGRSGRARTRVQNDRAGIEASAQNYRNVDLETARYQNEILSEVVKRGQRFGMGSYPVRGGQGFVRRDR